jgi:signal transduction histidine kinase
VKYTATAGTVSCVVRQEDDAATVEIHDNGIGIPAEEQAQLFGRFFRASTARALDIDGTGLGMTRCAQLT